jgi:xanthine/uracil/vitamin C permease (AzgA family)
MAGDTTEEPTYLGNLLFLVGSFFASALVTAAVTELVVSRTGLGRGVATAVLTVVVFVLAFLGLLLFYDRYYGAR